MALWQWSTTPANNASGVTSINWAEGQPPSSVNDSARQMMADIAGWYQSGPEWLAYGDTPTYVSATQFTVPGNLTSRYTVGRRVRAFVTAGTLYGTISSSAFTSLTTVGVTWDSGNLDSGLSEVDVGMLNSTNQSIPTFSKLNIKESTNSTSTVNLDASGDSSGANVRLLGNGASTPSKTIRVLNGQFQVINDAYTSVILFLDDNGNLQVTGNITANSDERLKKNWENVPSDFIERLSKVKSGTYERKDIKQRQAGVGAQSLKAVLDEFVTQGSDGILSVAYGQAALVACVELSKEVMRLRDLLEPKK